jgi:GNAT superfamily N-acetyltransferase
MTSKACHSLCAENHTWSTQETLRDGRKILIRSIAPSDRHLIKDELSHLSLDSIYNRFLMFKTSLSNEEIDYFTCVDSVNHVALVALISEGKNAAVAGVGRYIVNSSDRHSAELAFEVLDEYQGLGIATALLKHLVRIAKLQGLYRFTALVLANNSRMLNVFMHSGLEYSQRWSDHGVLEIDLTLSHVTTPREL